MLWFYYALGSAVMWELAYSLSEKIIHNGITPAFLMFVYASAAAPIFLYFASAENSLKAGIQVLAENKILLINFSLMIACYIIGNLFIFKSISLKNASLSNVIEVSYPLFTILFCWILYREFHLNVYTIAGSLMIMTGIGLIFLKS